jgi:hypothetical protein
VKQIDPLIVAVLAGIWIASTERERRVQRATAALQNDS